MEMEVGERLDEGLREMQVLLVQQLDQLTAEIEGVERALVDLRERRRVRQKMLDAVAPAVPRATPLEAAEGDAGAGAGVAGAVVPDAGCELRR